MGGDRSTAEPGNVSGQAGWPRNVIAFPGPRKLSPLWTDEEKHAAEAMRDAGFTALEIGNVLGRQAGAVYAWAKKSGVSMQGDKAKETRQWLAQGRSLMREGTAFGVIWRDPRLELQITFCASYLEKLLELGALMKVEGAQSVYELRS